MTKPQIIDQLKSIATGRFRNLGEMRIALAALMRQIEIDDWDWERANATRLPGDDNPLAVSLRQGRDKVTHG
jgi:hypothetical protein